MKRIYVLRHATAENPPTMSDKERPLSPSGKQLADQVAHHLASSNTPPEIILCSSATRTKETAAPIISTLQIPMQLHDKLYLAPAGEIFKTINSVEKYETLIIIGHNPGIHQFCLSLYHTGDSLLMQQLASQMPVAGLVTFSCNISSWNQLEPGSGILENIYFQS